MSIETAPLLRSGRVDLVVMSTTPPSASTLKRARREWAGTRRPSGVRKATFSPARAMSRSGMAAG